MALNIYDIISMIQADPEKAYSNMGQISDIERQIMQNYIAGGMAPKLKTPGSAGMGQVSDTELDAFKKGTEGANGMSPDMIRQYMPEGVGDYEEDYRNPVNQGMGQLSEAELKYLQGLLYR